MGTTFCWDYHPHNIVKVVCLSAFLTVGSVMGSGKIFLIKWVASTALSSLHPLSPLVSLSIIPMVDFHRPVLDWI